MMSCKMNSNHAYIHGYCSPCKRFFNSFFLSPLSNCNRLARGRSQRHYQTTTNPTTKPSTTTKYRNLAQKNIPKINPTQNQQKPQIYPIATTQHSAKHRPTGNPSEKPIWKIQQKPTGKPVGSAPILHWSAADLQLWIGAADWYSCGSILVIGAVDRSCG